MRLSSDQSCAFGKATNRRPTINRQLSDGRTVVVRIQPADDKRNPPGHPCPLCAGLPPPSPHIAVSFHFLFIVRSSNSGSDAGPTSRRRLSCQPHRPLLSPSQDYGSMGAPSSDVGTVKYAPPFFLKPHCLFITDLLSGMGWQRSASVLKMT
jgi:hypothetical protein